MRLCLQITSFFLAVHFHWRPLAAQGESSDASSESRSNVSIARRGRVWVAVVPVTAGCVRPVCGGSVSALTAPRPAARGAVRTTSSTPCCRRLALGLLGDAAARFWVQKSFFGRRNEKFGNFFPQTDFFHFLCDYAARATAHPPVGEM